MAKCSREYDFLASKKLKVNYEHFIFLEIVYLTNRVLLKEIPIVPLFPALL